MLRQVESLLLRQTSRLAAFVARNSGLDLRLSLGKSGVIVRSCPPLHAYTRKTYRMSSSRRIAWMLGIWLLILIVYTAVSLSLPRGAEALLTFGNLVQCVVPLLANAGLLLNAGTSLRSPAEIGRAHV